MALLPFDGLVWALRSRSWSDWAEKEWSSPEAVARAMKKRGWRRDSMGGMTHAPCRGCRRSVEVEALGCKRICETCRYGPVDRGLMIEMVAYLDRNPHMRGRDG